MFSLRYLLAAAPLLALTLAQNIAFTSIPAEIEAGDSFNITWGGGDGTGVTLTLRRGNPQDLETIDTIVDNVQGQSYYLWDVPENLEAADDYALQITQGQSDINYSGLFTITASSANTTSNSTSTSTATGSSNSTVTSMASSSGTGTALARNSTFSTATLTSGSDTFTFNDMTSTSNYHSATRTPSSTAATSAPSNEAPVRAGSSAALILGIVAAVMLH